METFAWSREVPEAWQADLDRLSPGPKVSRLALHWLAGLPDTPVQRWGIWEVIPRDTVGQILEGETKRHQHASLTDALWDALQGPDPRTLGHVELRNGKRVWRTKSIVSREQWDLHRQTGGLPMLSWIVEGTKGGHSWQFGPFEQHFLLALGADPAAVSALESAWPNPGQLPYADYDQRCFHALAERDLLRQWRQSLAWEDRSQRTDAGLILEGEAASRREDMMQRTLRWLDNQIAEAVSDIPRSLLPAWSDFTPTDQAGDEDALHLQVVQDTGPKDFRAAQAVGD